MSYINSTISEKTEIIKKIKELQDDLNNLYDKYASANEDLFNMVDTDLMKLKYKVMRVNNG
jgi:CHAD domain-containing protein